MDMRGHPSNSLPAGLAPQDSLLQAPMNDH